MVNCVIVRFVLKMLAVNPGYPKTNTTALTAFPVRKWVEYFKVYVIVTNTAF